MRISEAILQLIDIHKEYGDLEMFARQREGYAVHAEFSIQEYDEYENEYITGIGIVVE